MTMMRTTAVICGLLVALVASASAQVAPPRATGNITTQNLVPTGTATSGSCVTVPFAGMAAASVQVSGTYTGALSMQRTIVGTTWETLSDSTTFKNAAGTQTATIGSGTTGTFEVANINGANQIRVCGLAAMTGTAAVTIQTSMAGGSASGGGGGGAVTNAGTFAVQPAGSVAHDGVATGVNPVLIGGYASAAAPTNVSADGDAVRDWNLRSGAKVTQPSYAGVLATTGAGNVDTGTPRVTLGTNDAAIAALQAALTATNTQLPSALGPTTKSASLSVTGATDDPAALGIGGTADSAATAGSTGSISAKLRTLTGTIGTAGSSATSVISIQGIASGTAVPITGGSATANADSTRLPVSLDIASPVTGSSVAAGVLTNMPFAVGKGAQSVTVTITAISSATANFEYSPDGTDTYKTLNCWDATNTGSSGSVSSSTTVRVVICPVLGTHFQVRQSNAGSITATVIPNAAPSPKAIATVTVASSNQLPVLGAGAHDSATVGAPVRVGCRGRTSYYATTIANDDTVDVQCDLNGAAITKPYSVSGSDWTTTVNLTDTTSTALKASAGSSLKNYVTWCSFSGISTTVATQIKILDNATLKYPFNMKAGGGDFHVTFPTPIQGSAATAMNVQLSGSPTGAIDVTCGGYQGQ